MYRYGISTAVIASGLMIVAHPAAARTINLSTGLDAQGNVIPAGNTADANWTATSLDAESPPTAFTVSPSTQNWYAGWSANGPSSDWIASTAVYNNPGFGGPPYETTYTRTFTLSAGEAATASLTGQWQCDDSCTLKLNGNLLDGNGQIGFQPISAPAADFVAGTNTLVAFGGDGYLDALRVEAIVTAPEPASLAVLAGGLGGLLVASRRKTV